MIANMNGGFNPSGTIDITSNGTYNVKEYATASVNVQSTPELLWNNPSPTSGFAAQTVGLDLSGYTYVIIETKFSTTQNYYLKTMIGVGERDNIFVTSAPNTHLTTEAHRNANVTTTGIAFSTGISGSTNTIFAIPFRIWGVKFTL